MQAQLRTPQIHGKRTCFSDQGLPSPPVSLNPIQVSATLLGEPDLGLLTPPEMARKAGQIVYSIPGIPVLVDADTGEPKPQTLTPNPPLEPSTLTLLDAHTGPSVCGRTSSRALSEQPYQLADPVFASCRPTGLELRV